MPPAGGHSQRALGHLLPADVAEVFVIVGQGVKQAVDVRRSGLDVDLAREKTDRLGELEMGITLTFWTTAASGFALAGDK